MTAKELAEMLNGREYGCEIGDSEVIEARENGLVVVYGYSDDNMEFEGALTGEVGCYGGGEAYVTKTDVFYMKEDAPSHAKEIRAVWCDKESDAAWTYKTEISHETFNIYEFGELFCVGIVFSVEDLP